MITVKCLVACDVAETADRSRIMHLKPGLTAEIQTPTRDLVVALRDRKLEIVGRPSPDDVAALDKIAGEIEIGEGKARMDAAIAAQVRADAAALANASDAEIAASVAAGQTPAPAAPVQQPAIAVPPRAPRGTRAPKAR